MALSILSNKIIGPDNNPSGSFFNPAFHLVKHNIKQIKLHPSELISSHCHLRKAVTPTHMPPPPICQILQPVRSIDLVNL